MGPGSPCSEAEELARELLKELRSSMLERLKGVADETRRLLLLLAWLCTRIEDRGLGRLVVTGGFAVEVYTGRAYRTLDIDVVAEGCSAKVLEVFLESIGERVARGYVPRPEYLALKSIDIVSTVYDRELPPVKLLVDEFRIYVEPPETLIAVYLAGWKFWGSTEDRDKALLLLASMESLVDWGFLREAARRRRVEDYLERLVELVKRVGP